MSPRKTICPLCHQSIGTMRLGVRLPALKAKIFDAIKGAGDPGISAQEIIYEVYPEGSTRSSHVIKAHVYGINELLAGTDYRIRSERSREKPGRYILRRVTVRRVA